MWEAEEKQTASAVESSGSSRGVAMAMASVNIQKWNAKDRETHTHSE